MALPRTGGVQALSAAGGIAYVASLIDQGYNLNQIRAFAYRRFPQFQQRSVDALIERGYLAAEAGRLVSSGAAGLTLAASQVPGQAPGRTGYRYTTASTFTSPDTGDVEHFFVQIDSPSQLTPSQLRQRVGGLFGSQAYRNQLRRTLSGPQVGMRLDELIVTSVERVPA